MSVTPVDLQMQSTTRPVGFVRPTHERALRAFIAIEEHRPRDARANIEAILDSSFLARSWKALLGGMIALEEGNPAQAEALFLQAAAGATMASGGGEEEEVDPHALRVAACAMEMVGRADRRQDRPDDACVAHGSAYRLREAHGSIAEMWESALSVGLDCDLARRFDAARKWHRRAIELAERCVEEPAHRQAVAWSQWALSLSRQDLHEEAAEAARVACDFWRKHDSAAATAAQADMLLAQLLLKQGDGLHATDETRAKTILAEAVHEFTIAVDALRAFGPAYALDEKTCREQLEFAERLLSSLEN